MTSLRFEFDSLARHVAWPARVLAGAARALDDGLRETAMLCLAVGGLLIVADTIGGSYRSIWRYTSLPEAFALTASCALVLLALLALRAGGAIDLSLATVLLIVTFMLLLCVGARGLRRW